MNDILSKTTFSTILGIIGSSIIELLGGWDTNLTGLIVLMSIDFITGLILAIFWGRSAKSENGGVSSKACWQGIVKKVCTLLVVAASYQADLLIGTAYVRNAVIIAFCISEVISICENASLMGILPESVQLIFDKAIDVLKGKAKIDTDVENNKTNPDNNERT